MDPLKESYRVQSKHLLKALEKRNIEGFYCDSGEEAVSLLLSMLKEQSTIAWGGSVTVQSLGIKDLLRQKPYDLYDRDALEGQARMDMMRKAFFADYYLTSTNALTLDGELVNIDGTGNRVAAMCFGPKEVIVLAGMNKVVKNVECALHRIQNIASPPNTIRLNYDTPCQKTGVCHQCFVADCICNSIFITRRSQIKGRLKVILIGENLGF